MKGTFNKEDIISSETNNEIKFIFEKPSNIVPIEKPVIVKNKDINSKWTSHNQNSTDIWCDNNCKSDYSGDDKRCSENCILANKIEPYSHNVLGLGFMNNKIITIDDSNKLIYFNHLS